MHIHRDIEICVLEYHMAGGKITILPFFMTEMKWYIAFEIVSFNTLLYSLLN